MCFQWQENLKEAQHFVNYIIAIVSVEDAKKIAVESYEETKKEIQQYVKINYLYFVCVYFLEFLYFSLEVRVKKFKLNVIFK